MAKTPEGAPTSSEEKFEKFEVIRALKEPQVWLTGIGYMSLCVGMYSYSLFLYVFLFNFLGEHFYGNWSLASFNGSPFILFQTFKYVKISTCQDIRVEVEIDDWICLGSLCLFVCSCGRDGIPWNASAALLILSVSAGVSVGGGDSVYGGQATDARADGNDAITADDSRMWVVSSFSFKMTWLKNLHAEIRVTCILLPQTPWPWPLKPTLFATSPSSSWLLASIPPSLPSSVSFPITPLASQNEASLPLYNWWLVLQKKKEVSHIVRPTKEAKHSVN